MSKLIEIKYETLVKIVKLNDNIRKKAIKQALIYSLMQARNSVVKLARKEFKKSKNIDLKANHYLKRIRRGNDQVDMSYPIPRLNAEIQFSIFDEAISSFLYKKQPVLARDGRRYQAISPFILGSYLMPSGTFLRPPKKGRAIYGTLLSLARVSKDRLSYKKQVSNVSISDILLKDKSLYLNLLDKAQQIYHNRLSNNLNFYINKEITRFKNG